MSRENKYVINIRYYFLQIKLITKLVSSFQIQKHSIFNQVAYFTATLPAVLIIVVLIRAVTLDGASDGIIKYLWPDFSKLIKLEVSTQIL